MRIECTAYHFPPPATGRNFHRLPPGCIHFKPFSPHYPGTSGAESYRACSQYNRTSDDVPFVPLHRMNSHSKRCKFLESVPILVLLTVSSLYIDLIVNHITHILLNPNEMHSTLKFSFVEFPKCPQSLQGHLPQGEVR